MSDKFLNTGGANINLSNGTATLFGATIGAINLEPSQPLKTNSVRQLVSEKLDIADVNNLQSELNTKNELTFIENDTHTTPATGRVKLYVKTDGSFYKKDDAGVESGFGGGGGISTSNAPVVDNSLVVYDGTTGNTVKYVAGLRYDAVNNTLEVNDLETADTFSLNGELQKINNITSATQVAPFITVFNGELNVGKLKSITGNCEIELDNDDVDILTASGTVSINANDISLSTPTITLNGNNIDFWRKKGTVLLENFYIGNLSGNAQTTGNDNIGIGNNTLELNETGNDNIGIGAGAGKNVLNCSQNIAIGGQSGFYKSGATCVNNIAIGFTSQQGASGSTTGQYNNSLGSSSLYSLTSGSFNTAIGNNAGFSLTTGNDNTFVGAFCGDGNADDIGNTAIGRNCLTNGGSNRTCLGKQAETDADNQVCIGNSSVVEIRNLGNNTCDLGSALHQFKDIYLGGKVNCEEFELAGNGTIQRPFTITNPIYNKSLVVERQANGMGLNFNTGALASATINTYDNNLSLNAEGNISLNNGLGFTVTGVPYDFSFACSNEISTITTTGQKISLRCPRNFQSTNLKISVNSIGGSGFAVVVKKNGTLVQSVAQGIFLITNTADTTTYNEDDIITVEVSNTGSGTATGLKIYINGKT
jgi:hypothetical protein